MQIREEIAKKTNAPIIIVGVPRSGTTLLAAMIGAHSRISCGTETDFFHFLAQINTDELCAHEGWPDKAVDFLYSMVQANGKSPVPVNYGLDRDTLSMILSNEPPSPSSIIRAVTEYFMAKQGKQRWAEKTPRHMLHLTKIREIFPDARIIRIVRDPRDTALSIIKAPWKWAPRNFEAALSMWRFCDDAGYEFFSYDNLSFSIKYEDLVRQPVETLKQVCEFIGETFETRMLKTKNSYEQVNSIAEPWKTNVGSALDIARVSVWKRELCADKQKLALALIGDKLLDHGYEEKIEELKYYYPYSKDGPLYYEGWQEIILERNIKFWKHKKHKELEVPFFFGAPEKDFWLGSDSILRIKHFLQLLNHAINGFIRGKPAFWLKTDSKSKEGVLSKVLMRILCKITNIQLAGKRDKYAIQWRRNLTKNPHIGQYSKRV